MIICGIKFTHDGAVAVINNGKLEFCVEIEKINNNVRYSDIKDTSIIKEIIETNGFRLTDIDHFIVDGWGGYNQDQLALQPKLVIGRRYNRLSASSSGTEYELRVSQYEEKKIDDNVIKLNKLSGLKIGNITYDYYSVLHVASHIASAYFTSEFPARKESSYVLVWDGGMYPRLYYYEFRLGKISNLGPLFLLVGNVYSIFSQHFGPFKNCNSENFAKDDLGVAGKVMAYIAQGKVRRELFSVFNEIYKNNYTHPMGFANVLANRFKDYISDWHISDEDILRSFHKYLEETIIEKLNKKIKRLNTGKGNLCIAGGCGLNIKWNSAIRNSGIFKKVYVPPFPNDSGCAIGAGLCGVSQLDSTFKTLSWEVYSGPKLIKNEPRRGWEKKDCDIKSLAKLLHISGKPVVVLHGRAELGPRALGNRSILATATEAGMKKHLNECKKREQYRPISPVCIEKEAGRIFLPGARDPFMIFDHRVKQKWIPQISAVVHADNTARLQTISSDDNNIIYNLLIEYFKISGIPLLCNTSANYAGRGFFPDIRSAAAWGGVDYIWSDYKLYIKIKTND